MEKNMDRAKAQCLSSRINVIGIRVSMETFWGLGRRTHQNGFYYNWRGYNYVFFFFFSKSLKWLRFTLAHTYGVRTKFIFSMQLSNDVLITRYMITQKVCTRIQSVSDDRYETTTSQQRNKPVIKKREKIT